MPSVATLLLLLVPLAVASGGKHRSRLPLIPDQNYPFQEPLQFALPLTDEDVAPSVSAFGPNREPVPISVSGPVEDGTFTASVTFTHQGQHEILVGDDSYNVNCDPVTSFISDFQNASVVNTFKFNCMFAGQLLFCDCTDQDLQFTVTSVEHPNLSPNELFIDLDQDETRCDCAWLARTSGTHILRVFTRLMNTVFEEITHSPFVMHVPVILSGESVPLPSLSHKGADFMVKLRQSNGVPMCKPGLVFTAQVSEPDGTTIDVDVVNKKRGCLYRLDWTPRHTGKHIINVTFEGEPIKNSPYVFDVLPQPRGDAAFDVISALGDFNTATLTITNEDGTTDHITTTKKLAPGRHTVSLSVDAHDVRPLN